MPEDRVGLGSDAHRFTPGRPLVLGGVTIPHPDGLAGHSDADVVAHAVIDALLGAAALGDIGTHFPPGDPQWANADSLDLLRRTVASLREHGYRVGNLDVTVVAERPTLRPFIATMRNDWPARWPWRRTPSASRPRPPRAWAPWAARKASERRPSHASCRWRRGQRKTPDGNGISARHDDHEPLHPHPQTSRRRSARRSGPPLPLTRPAATFVTPYASPADASV